MTVKGCMFDFSGTLFRIEPCRIWLEAVLESAGIDACDDEVALWARRLERSGAHPGGTPVPAHEVAARSPQWSRRDISAQLHRQAHTDCSRAIGLPWEIHDALYERHMTPAAWQPYPDTGEVLAALRERGVPVAVVSNIGWDPRPVFAAHGLAHLVDAFVLSFECGRQKPDPAIFLAACEALAVAPRTALMVGDDRTADGGAAALGCRVHFVDHLPADRRPDGLRGVLDLLG